jgi:hypothetical protein
MDMSPSLAMNYMVNSTHCSTVQIAQCRDSHSLFIKFTNFRNLLIGKLGIALGFAARLAILAHHIRTIVELSAKKEMRGIATRRVIAPVTNNKTVGDGAIANFVAKSMRYISLLAEHKNSIAARRSTLPQPTVILVADLDFAPEGIFNGVCRHSMSEMPIDELEGFALYLSAFGPVSLGNLGFLATTAMAITEGNVVRGIMGLHKKLTFLVSKPWTVPAVAGLLLLVRTPVIIPQAGGAI